MCKILWIYFSIGDWSLGEYTIYNMQKRLMIVVREKIMALQKKTQAFICLHFQDKEKPYNLMFVLDS